MALHSKRSRIVAWQSSSEGLAGTKWNIRLNVGIEPGTWMPKRYPGWAESGARLGLETTVEFTGERLLEHEPLIGPKEDTGVLRVSINGPSSFVSEKGEEMVHFVDGGWCVQRPTANIRNAAGELVKPEGILRFWFDCPTGAKKRDTSIFPNTRIFGTTGMWDNLNMIDKLETEYQSVLKELETLTEETRAKRKEFKEDTSFKNPVKQAVDYRQMVVDAEQYDLLRKRKQELERLSPPQSASQSDNGLVKIAPTGSLIVKGKPTFNIKWLPTTEYLILGTFSTKFESDEPKL